MIINELQNANKGIIVEPKLVQNKIENASKTDKTCDSLLAILDDKNKVIASLQKQLSNQKKQLNFYLTKELRSAKIQELAQTCVPQAVDENISVSLAISKFYKNFGIKSRINCLYERMCQIDTKINAMLETQQRILREIVNSLYAATDKKRTKSGSKGHSTNFPSDKCQWDVFGNLLNSTISLRKELDTFRVCCDRLILIEDERNEIVEQVYSLPAEQRLNCNYIIGIEMEKVQLKNEMKNIMNEQSVLKKKVYELSLIEANLEKLNQECKTSISNVCTDYRISQLLEEVNAEAVNLLNISKEHKDKFTQEIQKLKEENIHLQTILKETYLYDTCRQQNDLDIENMYYARTKEMYDKLTDHFEKEKQKFIEEELHVSEKIVEENEHLNIKIAQLEREKHAVSKQLFESKRKLKEMQIDYNSEVEQLRSERDTYKLQVDDLLAIRSAYAQLIEKQTDVTEVEKNYRHQLGERDKAISDLQIQKCKLKNSRTFYEDVCVLQKSQIKYLLNIIEQLCDESEDPYEIEDTRTDSRSKFNEYSTPDVCNLESGSNTPGESIDLDDNNGYKKAIVAKSSRITNRQLKHNDRKTSELISPECGSRRTVTEKNYADKASLIHQAKTVVIQMTGEQGDVFGYTPQVEDNMCGESKCQDNIGIDNILEGNMGLSTTRLRIQSTHKDGKTEIMKAILESTSNVEGTFKLGDTSVSLKLDCQAVLPEIANEKPQIDEYELMKDCSLETIPVVCPPLKRIRQKGMMTFKNSGFRDGRKLTRFQDEVAQDTHGWEKPEMNGNFYEIQEDSNSNNLVLNVRSELKEMSVADVTRQLEVIASKVNADIPVATKKSMIVAEMRNIYEQFLVDI